MIGFLATSALALAGFPDVAAAARRLVHRRCVRPFGHPITARWLLDCPDRSRT